MSFSGEDNALTDVTNAMASTNVDAEAVKRVQDAQWAKPSKYDYDTYNANPRDQPMAPGEVEEGVPTWAANATKYEWSDEFGDVGPEHPALEKLLFGDEHTMKKGGEFRKRVASSAPCHTATNPCLVSKIFPSPLKALTRFSPSKR